MLIYGSMMCPDCVQIKKDLDNAGVEYEYKDFADSLRKCENVSIREILQPDRNPAVTVNVQMRTLIERSENQNFIPVTDDRGYFIGIVTRSTIIKTFCECGDDELPRIAVPYHAKAGAVVHS